MLDDQLVREALVMVEVGDVVFGVVEQAGLKGVVSELTLCAHEPTLARSVVQMGEVKARHGPVDIREMHIRIELRRRRRLAEERDELIVAVRLVVLLEVWNVVLAGYLVIYTRRLLDQLSPMRCHRHFVRNRWWQLAEARLERLGVCGIKLASNRLQIGPLSIRSKLRKRGWKRLRSSTCGKRCKFESAA